MATFLEHNRLRGWRCLAAALCLAAGALVSGCATSYLDAATREVDASEYRKPAKPLPVQLRFEFQTESVVNVRVTDALRQQVMAKVRDSGLFASVDDKPVPGGALLTVILNNVPLPDASDKGFTQKLSSMTGSKLVDGYLCTVSYSAGTQRVVKSARHAIYTTTGATSAPNNAIKVASLDQAVKLMTSQILSTVLNDVSRDDAFK